MSPVPYLHALPLLTTQSTRLAQKRLQLLSSFLYYFSLIYLDRPSTGAEVGRYERFVFLLLGLVCREFYFCLSGQYSFGVFGN